MQPEQGTPSIKHIFALAAVLLFAALVPIFLKDESYKLSNEDKTFIKGYVKYGIIIYIVLICALITEVSNYFIGGDFITRFGFNPLIYLSAGLSWIGILMIITGIFFVFADKSIFHNGVNVKYKKIKSGNFQMVTNFIPFYNLYIWYADKRDIKNFWRLKEGIILLFTWIILSTLSIQNPVFISLLFIIIIIGRVGLLLSGIDIINDSTKEKMDKLFINNPEEIFAYVVGPIKYVIGKLSKKRWKLETYINKTLEEYTIIHNIKTLDKKTLTNYYIEYGILLSIIITYLYYFMPIIRMKITGMFYIIPIILIIGRYTMVLINKKIIPIPMIHDIIKPLLSFIKLIK